MSKKYASVLFLAFFSLVCSESVHAMVTIAPPKPRAKTQKAKINSADTMLGQPLLESQANSAPEVSCSSQSLRQSSSVATSSLLPLARDLSHTYVVAPSAPSEELEEMKENPTPVVRVYNGVYQPLSGGSYQWAYPVLDAPEQDLQASASFNSKNELVQAIAEVPVEQQSMPKAPGGPRSFNLEETQQATAAIVNEFNAAIAKLGGKNYDDLHSSSQLEVAAQIVNLILAKKAPNLAEDEYLHYFTSHQTSAGIDPAFYACLNQVFGTIHHESTVRLAGLTRKALGLGADQHYENLLLYLFSQGVQEKYNTQIQNSQAQAERHNYALNSHRKEITELFLRNSNSEGLALLFGSGKSEKIINAETGSAPLLHQAISASQPAPARLKAVETLLAHEARLDKVNPETKQNVFHRVADLPDEDMDLLRKLLQSTKNIKKQWLKSTATIPSLLNGKDLQGKTPLHYAAFRGHTNEIKLILDKGGSLSETDAHGKSALDFAAQSGSAQAWVTLMDRVAALHQQNHLKSKSKKDLTDYTNSKGQNFFDILLENTPESLWNEKFLKLAVVTAKKVDHLKTVKTETQGRLGKLIDHFKGDGKVAPSEIAFLEREIPHHTIPTGISAFLPNFIRLPEVTDEEAARFRQTLPQGEKTSIQGAIPSFGAAQVKNSIGLYKAVMGKYPDLNGCYHSAKGRIYTAEDIVEQHRLWDANPKLPLVCTTGEEDVAFAEKLSELTGRKFKIMSDVQNEYSIRGRTAQNEITTSPYYFGRGGENDPLEKHAFVPKNPATRNRSHGVDEIPAGARAEDYQNSYKLIHPIGNVYTRGFGGVVRGGSFVGGWIAKSSQSDVGYEHDRRDSMGSRLAEVY